MDIIINNNSNSNTQIEYMNDFKNWIHLQNKYYCMKNNIINTNNDINFFTKNITLISSLKNYESQNYETVNFLNKFFHQGIIQKYIIDKNILRIKFQLNHEHIMYINIEVLFDNNNLIDSVNMSDGFKDRFF